jgi:hypothetical protein
MSFVGGAPGHAVARRLFQEQTMPGFLIVLTGTSALLLATLMCVQIN